MTDTALPDVQEMVSIHRVFRNAFAAVPGLVGGTADGDVARAAVVSSFIRNVLEFLHVHHGGEDELLFPKIAERADDATEAMRVAGQHDDVDRACQAASAALAAWSASASTADGQALSAAVADLDTVLTAHMDEEEVVILPLAERYVTADEWGELPGHAMGAFKGDDIFLIIGLVREQMTQEQRDRMLESMPPPAADAWRTIGIESYKRTVATLVGPQA